MTPTLVPTTQAYPQHSSASRKSPGCDSQQRALHAGFAQSGISSLALVLVALLDPAAIAADPHENPQTPDGWKDSILWSADHEEGDLSDWTFPGSKWPGGGILNSGGDEAVASATSRFAHSGRFAAQATIRGAVRGQRGPRAVRLMRWTDRPWDQQGQAFPAEAFYSTWLLIPQVYNPNKYAPWDPGDGGWWNVMQFKAHDANDQSQPMWTLNIAHEDSAGQMHFYLYSPVNTPGTREQTQPAPLPVGRWFHVEAFYRASHEAAGEITVWQDGKQILHAAGVRTLASGEHPDVVWGIGNYTDHIATNRRESGEPAEGAATLYFDDAIVSTKRASQIAGAQE